VLVDAAASAFGSADSPGWLRRVESVGFRDGHRVEVGEVGLAVRSVRSVRWAQLALLTRARRCDGSNRSLGNGRGGRRPRAALAMLSLELVAADSALLWVVRFAGRARRAQGYLRALGGGGLGAALGSFAWVAAAIGFADPLGSSRAVELRHSAWRAARRSGTRAGVCPAARNRNQ